MIRAANTTQVLCAHPNKALYQLLTWCTPPTIYPQQPQNPETPKP